MVMHLVWQIEFEWKLFLCVTLNCQKVFFSKFPWLFGGQNGSCKMSEQQQLLKEPHIHSLRPDGSPCTHRVNEVASTAARDGDE